MLVLKDARTRRGHLQPKKDKNLPQVLFQSCIRKKKRRKIKSSTNSSFSSKVSPEVTLYPAKKKNMVKEEYEIILKLLGIHPDLMEMIETRFKIVTEDEKFKWKFPKGMASYANKYFKEFIPEGDLKEGILTRSPLPENMDSVK